MAGFFKSRKSGFTIIEILVVITVVGILAGIVIISYNAAQKQAQDTRTISMVQSFAQAVDAYYTANGRYPSANSELLYDEEYGYAALATCIGTEHPNNICGTRSFSGSCGNQTLISFRGAPELIADLSRFMNTKPATITHPPAKASIPVSEGCSIVIEETGPTYAPYCYIVDEGAGEMGSMESCFSGIGKNIFTAYEIRYVLTGKDVDCGLPGAVANSQDAFFSENGTPCVIQRGERRDS